MYHIGSPVFVVVVLSRSVVLAGFHLVSLVMGERERGEWWVQGWAARKGG